jgi:hypothetical protein
MLKDFRDCKTAADAAFNLFSIIELGDDEKARIFLSDWVADTKDMIKRLKLKQYLISKGGDIYLRRCMPLKWACEYGSIDVAEYLLSIVDPSKCVDYLIG